MTTNQEKIENIELSNLTRNPYQPRVKFDQEKINELAQSIQENGVMQPIIVRKSKVFGYEILAGERRFLASQKVGLITIPVIIRDYSDQDMMTLALLENLQRENLTPIEEAKSLQSLATKAHMTHAQIAQILGKSRAYVSNLIRLLALPKEILYLVESNHLSPAHARTLLPLADEVKQLKMARIVIKKNLSVRKLENLVSKEKQNSEIHVNSDNQPNIYIKALEQELKEILGDTINIQSTKNYKGQLSVSFQNLDGLEILVKKLKS